MSTTPPTVPENARFATEAARDQAMKDFLKMLQDGSKKRGPCAGSFLHWFKNGCGIWGDSYDGGYHKDQWNNMVKAFRDGEEPADFNDIARDLGIEPDTLREWRNNPAKRQLAKTLTKTLYDSWKDDKLNYAYNNYGRDCNAQEDDFRVILAELNGEAHDGDNTKCREIAETLRTSVLAGSPLRTPAEPPAPAPPGGSVDVGRSPGTVPFSTVPSTTGFASFGPGRVGATQPFTRGGNIGQVGSVTVV